jgi:hypothetical protein
MRLSRLSYAVLTVAILTLWPSCGSRTRRLPRLSCFDAEKLKTEPVVFGDLAEDASSPDGWTGVEVLFGVNSDGGLTARIREGGGARQARQVDRVSYDARRDSITFTYQAPGHTKFTRQFRPSCSRLVGHSTYFRALEDAAGITVADTLPRAERK